MSSQQHHQPPSYATDPNTMFVQADPSNFRNIVQKLTGAPPDLSSSSSSAAQQKLPLTPKKPAFKLHERRQSSKKMELMVNNITDPNDPFSHFHRGFLVSPVSHLDPFWARVSPHSAREEQHHAAPEQEEQKAIAEKGFYFLPSPRSGAEPAPELLPLFPLRSPNAKVNYFGACSPSTTF
ncbi:PREDICTED: VQ motif-containing protein 11-like isoform X1 [Camelina sativa]|uniref:VQ motif-containing protein 11-like isoform X1 n=1 Tax=Camelina sativa TaxID=90675 RepID=A0ABM0WLT2_CAMSA|nr:PREDICTED: VQ motif-containing protein 11-like isoform X1 [Camelina sativa]